MYDIIDSKNQLTNGDVYDISNFKQEFIRNEDKFMMPLFIKSNFDKISELIKILATSQN